MIMIMMTMNQNIYSRTCEIHACMPGCLRWYSAFDNVFLQIIVKDSIDNTMVYVTARYRVKQAVTSHISWCLHVLKLNRMSSIYSLVKFLDTDGNWKPKNWKNWKPNPCIGYTTHPTRARLYIIL